MDLPIIRYIIHMEYMITTVALMHTLYRCFLSSGSPASSPAKSRLVEAICIRLCHSITQPQKDRSSRGKERQISRWKLILSAYNGVRARLFNSQALLEGTNMVLYTINETTLVRWYKNSTRRREIQMLLQGRLLPHADVTTSDTLPPAQQQPTYREVTVSPHTHHEPEDTTGQAHRRGCIAEPPATQVGPSATQAGPSATQAGPSATQAGPSATQAGPSATQAVSRTTQWRHRQKAGTESGRKYCCSVWQANDHSGPHTVSWPAVLP